ncbi:replication-relaxation family protein [Aporhodopirellula aestuarii]|uniref:replication-relaxation family protein n=1 Tax=Aporhodopirellula aestuarii TaxID=2950107 RepID=UPI0038992D42
MATLCKRGSVKEVGTVLLKDTGRKNKVFCTQDIRPDRVRHELYLTKWLLNQEADYVVRYADVDASLRPDAELHFEDGLLFVELDTGSESHEQVRQRMAVYQNCTDPVVWVCLTEKRLDGIKDVCPYSHHLFSLWNVSKFL